MVSPQDTHLPSWVVLGALAIILGFACPPLAADTVKITGGGHIAGSRATEFDQGTTPSVRLTVDEDIAVWIQKQRVRHVRTSQELSEYSRLAAEAKDDPEKHYKLAIWCKGNNLDIQSRYHMQRVIAIEPDHEVARAALDFVRDDQGSWILYSQSQRNRGMVYVGARWQYPESVAKQQMFKQANVTSGQWAKKVPVLRKQYLSRSKRANEAFQELKAIKDPLAAEAVAAELQRSAGKNNSQPRELRRLWVRLLGSFRNTLAVRTLVFTALEEYDVEVREDAIKELKSYGYRSAVATCLKMLAPKNSSSNVRKALRLLSHFPDRELAMTYIEVLETTHQIKVPQGGGNTNAGFTQDGGNSFSTGKKEVVITKKVRNDAAHTLLTQIEPNADYGFNKQAWRQHFANQLTSYNGSLRRDP